MRDWAPDFLASLALVPNVAEACRNAGITRKAAYDARRDDPEFAEAWQMALDESTDTLVGEAYRRAVSGTLEPVFYLGQQVGSVRKYSDALAMFLLKAHRRGTYGDKVAADLTTKGNAISQTIFYLPENGRGDTEGGQGDSPSAGPADGLPE